MIPSSGLEHIRRDLQRADAFPVPTTCVTTAETHISLVFLTDTRAFKIKKPVRFPFLDYSTVERRKWACEEEVRLNRRLAPNVYLGVLPITKSQDGLRIAASGAVVDYCVEMVRLPESSLLDVRILRRDLREEDVDRLLDLLVDFYRNLPRSADLHHFAAPIVFQQAVRENVDTLTENGPSTWKDELTPLLPRIRSSQWQFLALGEPLFLDRIAQGHIVEGHGDLRPEHICLLNPPVIFDCVEFSLPFRVADVASELAFLAMECDFLGDHALGKRLLHGYSSRSGESLPHNLVSFYKAYRATVRAKVELLRSRQESAGETPVGLQRARRYLQLAVDYASEFHRPWILVTVGASGSGKSTLAKALAEALGTDVIRTDVVRHQIADEHAIAGDSVYSMEMTDRTYDAVFQLCHGTVRAGVSVVLDGTFLNPAHRAKALRVGREVGAPVLFLRCGLERAIAERRIAERQAAGDDVSDATPDLVASQLERLQASTDLGDPPAVSVDTSHPVADCVQAVLDRLRSIGLGA